jgi:hypothetical protein
VDVRFTRRVLKALRARLKRVKSVDARLVVRVADIHDNRRSIEKGLKLSGF